jgi:FkbM family methyltransferase
MVSRLWRAGRRRAQRLIHGPNRTDVPRELWREGVFFLAGRFRDTLTVRWPAGTFVVSTRDYDVSRRTYVSGPYGLERLLRLGGLVELRGREVLEVGANIGTTTVPFVTLLNAARVHACEPIRRNLALLELNVVRNGLRDRVTIHDVAVSDRPGTLSFSLADRYWGSSRVAAEGQPARATTIDALLATGLSPALVWIDVEGHEAAVLAGARTLGSVPIVIEHDPSQHADLAALHEEISRRAGRLIDLSSGEPVSLEGLGTTDLLILP